MPTRFLPYLLTAFLAAPLPASPDWLALPVPRPLASSWSLSLGLSQAQRETWAHQHGHVLLKDAEGQKVQRLLQGQMGLRWQSGPYDSWVLTVPVAFNEAAVWTGAISSPRVDDPGVDRSQGLGDLGLGWRHDRGGVLGPAWGLGLSLLAPTGLGPWEAPHPRAATGEGRWQGLLRLSAGYDGMKLGVFASATGRWQGGREAVLSGGAPVLYDAAGERRLPAGLSGAAYLDPRWGAEGALGLGWHWHRGEDSAQTLALSACASHLGPLSVGGRAVDETAPLRVWLQPELQSRYGRFNALVAWQSPALIDDNAPVAYWGELQFRLDHAF